ncbi:MAG: hypothetical protein JWQ74_369 [Marmoricola sp.]|nr:hypothetical protein [Marmoricola sp.]
MLITSYVPYALPGYVVAVGALLLLRGGLQHPMRRAANVLLALAVLGVSFHLALLAPSYVGSHPKGPVVLTVVSLNLRLGQGDAVDAVRFLDEQKAQAVVLEEVTPLEYGKLLAAGISGRLPYRIGAPGPDANGTLIFSAYPLSDAARVPLHHGSYQVRVAAPTPFWLVGVHVAQPISSPSDWRADWGVLNEVVPALDGPVVLAGDFNTTLDHDTMRSLLGKGFADAARESNAGWQPTWPSGRGDYLLPNRVGLLAIDHVLVRGSYGVVATLTRGIAGTDHRALVARLALR